MALGIHKFHAPLYSCYETHTSYFSSIGQFRSRGSVLALQVIPALKGVGVAQQIGTACVTTYYCSLIALTLIYMVKSFSMELPWTKCDPQWANVSCIDSAGESNSKSPNATSSSELYFT